MIWVSTVCSGILVHVFRVHTYIILPTVLILFFKVIDPLPPIDHSDIDYDKFSKNFYEEHREITKLSEDQVTELRSKLGIRVSIGLLLLSVFCHFDCFFVFVFVVFFYKAQYLLWLPMYVLIQVLVFSRKNW